MRVLFVLGAGGHTARGLILSKQITADVFYIVPWESEHTKKRVGTNYFSVLSPRFRAGDNIFLTILRTLLLFIHGLLLLLIVRPRVAISTGSGLTYPIFLTAKFLGIKTVFIESPGRVYKPSKAGTLLLGKVDLFLSTWPELSRKYKEIEYMGMIK